MLDIKELKQHEFIHKVNEAAVNKYNSLSPAAQARTRFYVWLESEEDGDGYGGGCPMQFPSKKTWQEALECVRGCCYNEVLYHFSLAIAGWDDQGFYWDDELSENLCGIM